MKLEQAKITRTVEQDDSPIGIGMREIKLRGRYYTVFGRLLCVKGRHINGITNDRYKSLCSGPSYRFCDWDNLTGMVRDYDWDNLIGMFRDD